VLREMEKALLHHTASKPSPNPKIISVDSTK
jgi:hypothetical protein